MTATYDTDAKPAPSTKRVHVRNAGAGSAPVCWPDRAAAEGYAGRIDQLRGKRRWAYTDCDGPESEVRT